MQIRFGDRFFEVRAPLGSGGSMRRGVLALLGLAGCYVKIDGVNEEFEGDYDAVGVTCPAEEPEDTTAALTIEVDGDEVAFYLRGRGDFEVEATGCASVDGTLYCGGDEWQCWTSEIGLDCEHQVEDQCVWHFERW